MKRLLLFLLALSLCVQFSSAQEISKEASDHLRTRVKEGFNASIALAYIEDGEVTYYNFGKTSLPDGKSVDQNSVYEIGSISKVFTCILLADEVLKGNMSLEDPVSKYLPKAITVPQKDGKIITLKDLATHTSGLPRMPDNFDPADYSNPFADYTIKQLYTFLSSYELPRAIGSQYEYSNLGMGLLGHVLELHTGKSYEDLVIERIATPLGMTSTAIVLTDSMKERLAKGHNEQLEEVSNWDIITLAGAGGIRSTTSDMVKFIKANMSKEDSPLHKAMRLSHKIAYAIGDTSNFQLGLGWHYAINNTVIWHNGGTGGYKAFAGFVKDGDKGVVALTNSASSLDALGLKVLDDSAKLELPKKTVFKEVIELPEDVLETYVGVYELSPEFKITITKDGKKLFAQATGQSQFEIFPFAKNEFFLKVVEASITFNTDDSGKVNSMTLHQGGQNIPAPKVE